MLACVRELLATGGARGGGPSRPPLAFLINAASQFSTATSECQLESIAPEDELARIYLMHDFDILNLWPFCLQ